MPSQGARSSYAPTLPQSPEPDSARLLDETLLTVAEIARHCRVDTSSVSRWMLSGVVDRRPGAAGRRHYLESCRIGGRLYSSREALERYVAAQSADIAPAIAEPAPTPGASPGRRARCRRVMSSLADRQG
ncbi:MAG TPA: helix-turn-helix domain-containing protein [Isosphaeraceae bacterium]|nr:helix-turn-helix domain-containing protein [Isosphaeraceae bacterium]